MPATDWQPDPTGRHQTRRRNPDGTWSDQVADHGVLGRDAYDGEQPDPTPPPEPEPESDEAASPGPDTPTATADKRPFWTRTKVTLAIILAVVALYVAACGPETICMVQGGDPVENAFGMEWCELDGNRIPSEGDFSLNW